MAPHPLVSAAEAAEAVVSFLQDFERLSDEQQQREAAGEEEALAAPAAASDTERDRGLAGSEDAATADEAEADGEAGTARAFKRRKRGHGASAPAAAPRRPRLTRPLVPLRKLQRLGEALSQTRGVGAVARVDSVLLGRLLGALQGHVELGLDHVVAEDEEVW
jgi:hypothetical protein